MLRMIGKMAVLAGMVIVWAGTGVAEELLTVCTSILPQRYFVDKIGGDLVDVHVMVPPGESPATYEPKPRQMADLVKTRVYFAIGVPFENAWLGKIVAVNSNMKVVHTEQGIEKIPMSGFHQPDEADKYIEAREDRKDAESADDEMHSRQGGLDPHIWLSPPLVKRQAQTILTAFLEIDPTHAGIYEANYRGFISEIDALDSQLKEIFNGSKARVRFMVFHPSWGYFARAYGLEQISIEIEGKDPKPAQLRALIEHATEENIRVIFVQPQFSTKSAALIAREIGGRVIPADPLAEDWVANLLDVAEEFRISFE